MNRKEKKKYSLWSTYKFVYGMGWKITKKAVFYPILRAILEMLMSLLNVALPAVVVYCLEEKFEF